jgi:4-oxalocrotonate tautomerase
VVPLVELKLIEGTTTADQKIELIERLTDAVVSVRGEDLRPDVWVVITEVPSGAWGAGGVPVS